MSRFRTYLFDLDGTLIDHFAAIHRCYAHTLPQFGLPAPTYDEVRAAVGGGLENALRRFVREDQIEAAAAAYREYWNRTMLDGVEPMAGAGEILAALAEEGAAVGVLTNKLGSSSRLICDHLGFTIHLRAVVGAGDTSWLKPEPRLTAHTLKLLGAGPEGAVMIGDSPYDVATARAALLPAWMVTTGTHTAAQLKAEGADAIFPDLTSLQQALGYATIR